MGPANQNIAKAVRLPQRYAETRTDESRRGSHDERQEGQTYRASIVAGDLCCAFPLGVHWKTRKRRPCGGTVQTSRLYLTQRFQKSR